MDKRNYFSTEKLMAEVEEIPSKKQQKETMLERMIEDERKKIKEMVKDVVELTIMEVMGGIKEEIRRRMELEWEILWKKKILNESEQKRKEEERERLVKEKREEKGPVMCKSWKDREESNQRKEANKSQGRRGLWKNEPRWIDMEKEKQNRRKKVKVIIDKEMWDVEENEDEEEIKALFNETLSAGEWIKGTKRLKVKDGKIILIVELRSEGDVEEVLRRKRIIGKKSRIVIQKDIWYQA
ncbi:golgin subfamily A member 6-like protein 22 [Ceratina calcarata]|uniref:Golgin subfamily A member 6-like protein 22 n=1 Tax=Ceratina calcarata TaxID=156304 RepID=A0AAJ7W987_9HYME|nr:golgin subfamily A member 6-like protein 22 [Ceratina calcarata]